VASISTSRAANSSIGTINGGLLTMVRFPSTTVVSFASAWVLSRVCAFAISALVVRTAFFGVADAKRSSESSTSMCAYQTCRTGIRANARMASRYAAPVLTATARRCLAEKPLSRPATDMLATSRLTSHSNGPGSVSSKSLTSKTNRRSGEPKAPKFDRCASPHSCTRRPVDTSHASKEVARIMRGFFTAKSRHDPESVP
jgi:hypothetical protein